MSQDGGAPGAQPDNIEHASTSFQALISTVPDPIPPDFDPVAQIVRPILTTALDWQEQELTPCDTVAPPFKCVRLCTHGASRAAVVIRNGPLGLEGRNADRPYRLSGPVLGEDTSAAAPAIKQACMVCGLKNCELAAVTNGREWIVFRVL